MKAKKLLSAVTALLLLTACGSGTSSGSTGDTTTAAGAASSSGSKDDILVWAAEEIIPFTQTKCDEFLTANPDIAENFTITVSAMGEGEAATQMITDVEAGADVFGFAQDQLGRLVQAGALSQLGGTFLSDAEANNDVGSVSAAKMGDAMYAYPLTSDNGYFLFYDKSVVSDPSSLDNILQQCADAGKYFYMDNQSGWYLTSFFFGAGCEYTTESNENGEITLVNCDFNSDEALGGFKALIGMAASNGFQRSDSFAAQFNPEGGQAGAAISGVWDATSIKEFLGDNYGVAKLPTMTVDGEQVQMGAWGGFKLMGVNPTQSNEAVVASHKLAAYLTSEQVQLDRYNSNGWGPSNINAQQNEAVLADEALAALQEQLVYSPAQPQCSSNFWAKMEAFGTDVNSGAYAGKTDDELKAVLNELTDYLVNDVTK